MGLLWITNAKYLNNYRIELEFNDNKKGVLDFEPYLNKQIFEPLKNVSFFKEFKLNSWTIEWENGADFSPEFLYNNLLKTN
jgi:uncharacterized protein YjbK